MLHIPSVLNDLLLSLVDSGANPIFVGGYVRDALLKVESKDIDIEVHGVDSLESLIVLLEKFGDINSVGKSFGVLKLNLEELEIDFSLPRRDNKIGAGHTGFKIEIAPELSFKEAARRRDFTINALGFEYKSRTLLDPFNGVDDLNHSILREVDKKHFAEDPLRVYRAVQFTSRFELTLSPSLNTLCQDMIARQLLQELPQERIYEEYKKLLLKSNRPSLGIKLLEEFSLLGFQSSKNILEALDQLAQNKKHNKSLELMFGALLFSHPNPTKFLSHFSRDKKRIDSVVLLIKMAKEIQTYTHIDNYLVNNLSTKINISLLLELTASLNLTPSTTEQIRQRATILKVLETPPTPLIQGRDLIKLELKPSKVFKEILNICYKAQLEEKFDNYSDAFTYMKNILKYK